MANVHIHNKRSQKMMVSILDSEGKPTKRTLKPREKTEPIPESRVGAYTHKLVRLGHVRLRPAR